MALSSVGLGPGKEYYSAMEKTDICMKSSFLLQLRGGCEMFRGNSIPGREVTGARG